MGILLITGSALLWFRRWFHRQEDARPLDFKLDDLRRMHGQGDLTDTEYQALREQTIERVRRLGD